MCYFPCVEKQQSPIMLTYGVKYYVPDPAKLREDYSRYMYMHILVGSHRQWNPFENCLTLCVIRPVSKFLE